jgi:hypothetical protein
MSANQLFRVLTLKFAGRLVIHMFLPVIGHGSNIGSIALLGLEPGPRVAETCEHMSNAPKE